MKISAFAFSQRRMFPLLVLASSLVAAGGVAHAQAMQPTQDQTTGVSHPPADDAIVANDETQQPQQAPATKPTPYVAQPQAAPQRATNAQAASAEDPDYGIVTSVPSSQPAAAPADLPVHLVSRPSDPSDGIVDMVPSGPNQLAEGTNINVRLLQNLDTDATQPGTPFRAQVVADVYKDGRVVIPMGAELRGRVTEVTHGHHLGMHATIRLRPDYVLLPDGTAYHLNAEVISSATPGTHVDDEGGIQASYHVVKDLAEYGGGAGGGAVVGAALGGPIGAGAGAVVGAGMVTTHMLLQKPAQASLETGSGIVFSLTEPMDLVPTRN